MLWVVTVGYWVTAFTLTHIPRVPPVGARGGDKTAHVIAYALLGALVYLSLWSGGRVRGFAALVTLGVALAYGALDELTQPLVGRSCELGDWVADAAGAALAVGVLSGVRRLLGRVRGSSRDGA